MSFIFHKSPMFFFRFQYTSHLPVIQMSFNSHFSDSLTDCLQLWAPESKFLTESPPKHAAGISCSASKKESPTRCCVSFFSWLCNKNLVENLVFCRKQKMDMMPGSCVHFLWIFTTFFWGGGWSSERSSFCCWLDSKMSILKLTRSKWEGTVWFQVPSIYGCFLK